MYPSWVSTKPEPLAAEVVVCPKMFTVVFTVMPTQEARLAAYSCSGVMGWPPLLLATVSTSTVGRSP